MEYQYLSETVAIKKISETDKEGVFEVDGLYSGYGLTIGNALRRVLLSSLPGAAITQFKIKGVNHEFSALDGIKEDMVEIGLNLKKVRFRIHTDEPQVLNLKIKGEKSITASDIKINSQVELITPDISIATLTEKNSELDMEITVEKGLGYAPAEARKSEKLPIGVIALDALFSPVVGVNFTVENMRVGERADYNRLRLIVETDGSVTPSAALRKASNILQDHFVKISSVEVKEAAGVVKEEKPKKTRKTKKTQEEKE
ncbi:MAG: DNA-directed RNA polymerase subunit alpha [Candidatus Harrisonbacteria bacterium]|nr:DNA-directed RNA polymerase subunit alpha [Candidatus Harrisonbacteria bacterium]